MMATGLSAKGNGTDANSLVLRSGARIGSCPEMSISGMRAHSFQGRVLLRHKGRKWDQEVFWGPLLLLPDCPELACSNWNSSWLKC